MTEERKKAGADYLSALRSLGFDPELLLWIREDESGEFRLAIVSSLVDRVGSTELYDVLFEAYEKAATPRSIDPWIIVLFSPKMWFPIEIENSLSMGIRFEDNGTGVAVEVMTRLAGYTFDPSWVYVSQQIRAESKHQLAAWKRFRSNVQKAA